MTRALVLMGEGQERRAAVIVLSRELGVDEVEDVASARSLLLTRRYSRALIDLDVPDGDGLELLDWMRDRGLRYPVLLTAHVIERRQSERAHLLGAPLLTKPLSTETLAVLARPHRGRSPVSLARELAERHALTPRQTDVVIALARGTRPSRLPAVLEVSRSTAKKLVHQVLVKVGVTTLDDVVTDLLVAADRASDTR